MMISQKACR